MDKCTAPGGIVLCESETGIVLPAEAGGLTLQKQYKYGRVLLWKYTKPMQPAAEHEGRSTMNVNELLDTIEDALEEGANVPLSGGKTIVDVEQIRDYLDEIRANLARRAAAGPADRERPRSDRGDGQRTGAGHCEKG